MGDAEDGVQRDVFMSYSWKDKVFAIRLARDLRSLGVTVWIDEWEMKVGDSHFKQLADLDRATLEKLVVGSIAEVRRRHG